MNEREYVDQVCSKCLNDAKDSDLCNIVKTIDGGYRCSNEDIVETGEYTRNKLGYIGKVKKVIDKDAKLAPAYICCDTTMASGHSNEIKKHNKELYLLLEIGDIVQFCINSNIEKIGIVKQFKDTKSNTYLGIDGWGLEQIKIIKVLSHEQFEENCFEGVQE